LSIEWEACDCGDPKCIVLWRIDLPFAKPPHDGKDWPLDIEHLPPMTAVRSVRTAPGWIAVRRGTPDRPYVLERLPECVPAQKPPQRTRWRATETPKVSAPYTCAKCSRGFEEQATLHDHLQTGCWSYDAIDALPSGKIDWIRANELLASAIHDRDDDARGKLMIVMLRLLRDKCKSSRYVKGKKKSYFETSKKVRGKKGERGEGNYHDRMSIAIHEFVGEIEAARDNPHHPLRMGGDPSDPDYADPNRHAMLRYDADRELLVPKIAAPIINQVGPEATDRDINIALKKAGLPKNIRKETLLGIHEYQAAEWGGDLPPGLPKKRRRHWSQNHQRRAIYWLINRAEPAIKDAENADFQYGVVDVPDTDAKTRRNIERKELEDDFAFHYPTTNGELEVDADGDLAVVESGESPMFDLDSRVTFSCGDEFLVPKKSLRANAGGFALVWDDLTFWIALEAGIITGEGKPNLPKWIERNFGNGDRQILLMLWWGFTQEKITRRINCEPRPLSGYVFALKNRCRALLYLMPIRKVASTKPASFGEHIALDALRTIGEVRHSGSSIPMTDVATIIEVRRTMKELIGRLDLQIVAEWFTRFDRQISCPVSAFEQLVKSPVMSVTE
jgi:hypothetical protein